MIYVVVETVKVISQILTKLKWNNGSLSANIWTFKIYHPKQTAFFILLRITSFFKNEAVQVYAMMTYGAGQIIVNTNTKSFDIPIKLNVHSHHRIYLLILKDENQSRIFTLRLSWLSLILSFSEKISVYNIIPITDFLPQAEIALSTYDTTLLNWLHAFKK